MAISRLFPKGWKTYRVVLSFLTGLAFLPCGKEMPDVTTHEGTSS